MKFLIFLDFFSELKIDFSDFYKAQVMWCNLERQINHNRQSKAGDDMVARGASDHAIKSRSSIVTKGGSTP